MMEKRRKPNRMERRKKIEDQIWTKYKKPTSRRIFYRTFQRDALSAGVPPTILYDPKELRSEIRDFLMNFRRFESYNLSYLEESVLPIRYCFILPRNYAALLFALYVNAIAIENKMSFIDCYRKIELINEHFKQPAHKLQDIYLTNADIQNRFLEIFERKLSGWTMKWIVNRKKPAGVFYLINTEMECIEVNRRFNVPLLFDFEIFGDLKKEIHAFLDFSAWHRPEIQEGIVFFENKKNIQKEQDLDIFYVTEQDSVKSTRFHWNPHAYLAAEKMGNIRPELEKPEGIGRYPRGIGKIQENLILTPKDAMRLIERHKPKILNKTECSKFRESLKMQNIKKSEKDLTRNFELSFPKEEILIQNYFLSLNILGPPIGRFYPLHTSAYIVVKRHLFLYKLVAPFRELLGLPKRIKKEGIVRFITPPVCEEIPLETRERLKNYATPSQVLFKIVENVKHNQGDIEASLKYIRGIYRASRKISLMMKKKEFDLIPKIVTRYL